MDETIIEIHRSDLEKIQDALVAAMKFHTHRDSMNAHLHLSEPRWSPLTSRLMSEVDRVHDLLVKE